MTRVNHTLRPALLVGLLAASAALTACQDDAPSPVGPPLAASASKTGSGKPGTTETVLFSAFKTGSTTRTDIYAMNPDGSNVRRLTSDSTDEYSPDFAPDNRRFVFVRYHGGAKQVSELYIANADGSKATQLTTMGTTAFAPRWSPDGSKIAFNAVVTDSVPSDVQNFEIFVINADGTGLKRLTYYPDFDVRPTWSPDGRKIAFRRDIPGGVSQLYVMNADGLDVQSTAVCNVGGCDDAAWSPDGSRIAYVSLGLQRVEVVDLATKTVQPVGPSLVGTPAFTRGATWSKDGTQVLFASSRGIEHTFELYIGTPGSADAGSIRRLTVFSPGGAEQPAYSH